MGPSKILIVDDEPEPRQLFARVLRKEGYNVEEADTGKQGLEIACATVPDLVLLDLYLPDTSGLDLLPRVLKICPAALVVIMTGRGEVETAVEAMKRGAVDYLVKPFEIERLRSSVRALFLDEIGNLPLHFQAKLLRVLQERHLERLGGNKPIPIDVRIISATNLDMEQAMRKGTFREDLYYRLAEIVIRLPPLRERIGDIEVLADYFVQEFNRKFERNIGGIAESAWSILRAYRWPGNVRELENVIKSSLLAADDVISGEHLPEYLSRASFPPAVMEAASGLSSDSIRKQIDEGLAKGLLDLKTLVARYAEEIIEQVLSCLFHKRNFTRTEPYSPRKETQR